MAIQKILDFDNRWNRFLDLSEELQADRANMFGHAVQHKARRRDDAVAAFFLNARKSGEKFIGDVFPQTGFAKHPTGDFQRFFADEFLACLVEGADAKFRKSNIMDLAHVVAEPLNLHPLRIRRHHFPRRQIIECSAPQHRFLAARVHGHIAADAARIRTRRVARPHEARQFRRFHRALGHHARLAADRGNRLCHAWQSDALDSTQSV